MKAFYSIILLLFISQISTAQIQGYALNDVVSDFTVTDIHGEEHNLYSYTAAGKYVFIDFSFVNCPPCQATAPIFNEFYDKYGCNDGDLVCMSMFGLASQNDTNADVEGFENTYGGTFNHAPAVSIEGGAGPVDLDFSPYQYPTVCLVNPDNEIIELDIWPISSIGDLEATFPTGFDPSPMSCTAVGNFTVATEDGTAITDGSVHTFSHLGDPDGTISFNITNTSAAVIDMRLEFVSMANADDTGDWICVFGVCLPPTSTTPGDVLPLTGSNNFTKIDPGVTTDYGDHFYNTDPGNGTYPLEYVFKFFEVDASGNEIGESITFTYQYDGTASVEDLAQVGFKLYPNVSSDYLNLEVNEDVSAEIINTQGQLIKQYNFESGNHTIDVSSLSKQMYYLKLSNMQGAQSLAKFIVN